MSNRQKRNMLDDIFEEMNKIIREMIEEEPDHDTLDEPHVWGFSLTQIGNEPPEIREFGNMNVKEFIEGGVNLQPDDRLESGGRKSLIDILEAEDTLHVVVEMPGVTKEDISLDLEGNTLCINAQNESRKYSEFVELPAKVLSDSVKATYKNGVLEVIFNYDISDRKTINIE